MNKPTPSASDTERDALFRAKLIEESANEEVCLWLSFCDTDRPKGEQFLGVVIT